MADLPLSTDRSPIGVEFAAAPGETPGEGTVPPWLAARRARLPVVPQALPEDVELEIEFAAHVDESEVDEPEVDEHESATEPVSGVNDTPQVVHDDSPVLERRELNARPAGLPSAIPPVARASQPLPLSTPVLSASLEPHVPPPLPSASREPAVLAKVKGPARESFLVAVSDDAGPQDHSLKGRVLRWMHSALMTGVWVSALVHVVVLSVLALLVLGSPALHRGLDIFGALGDPNENLAELDAAMPFDPGQEAAPLEFQDVTQMISVDKAAFDPSDSIRGLPGGAGKGNGDGSGDGDAMALPAIKIPGYAVTKGSFSAWTEPKDPAPLISYEIVIQFRLPTNVKTYRSSDLTGMVVGTDGYKQVIRFRRDEALNVRDGSVQVRIRVPGAERLVRDTIRVESKVLREKQTIEIEF